MHIQINDKTDANFPVKISGVNAVTLHDTANMSCISYACYTKLKDSPSLKMVFSMSVHSATGHDLCLKGLTYCKVTRGKSKLRHTFIMYKKLQKLLIGLDMQQLQFRLSLD